MEIRATLDAGFYEAGATMTYVDLPPEPTDTDDEEEEEDGDDDRRVNEQIDWSRVHTRLSSRQLDIHLPSY